MSKVRIRVEGHYEVQEVPYGKDYVWQPGRALVECDCGQAVDADEQYVICSNCGTDHTGVVREAARRLLSDEVLHPWHPDYERWVACGESEDYASELGELE